ncbi:hypothetical protein GLOTRDRAFT_91319 [Gloeophyllum trabeum ATCC 11539]|uniref:Uncharacterized protein n=1 Tax=Gloeophyllum trabeum (strain ATCC 11539 / FP-39264 / Madison 617) TaxID=670483 RepID=S7RY22_GLOTA|nr:uncharacterized protein GLOTRDRAFT_91319 [Gloeophyllum trabeum ATCC 11539]EPQ59850.1 hypothetical protein GLOTRDRAFT_91319 [Gloeophyllum trabeum ATCC 11539]
MSLLRQAKPTPTPFSSDWEQASECDEELWGIMRTGPNAWCSTVNRFTRTNIKTAIMTMRRVQCFGPRRIQAIERGSVGVRVLKRWRFALFIAIAFGLTYLERQRLQLASNGMALTEKLPEVGNTRCLSAYGRRVLPLQRGVLLQPTGGFCMSQSLHIMRHRLLLRGDAVVGRLECLIERFKPTAIDPRSFASAYPIKPFASERFASQEARAQGKELQLVTCLARTIAIPYGQGEWMSGPSSKVSLPGSSTCIKCLGAPRDHTYIPHFFIDPETMYTGPSYCFGRLIRTLILGLKDYQYPSWHGSIDDPLPPNQSIRVVDLTSPLRSALSLSHPYRSESHGYQCTPQATSILQHINESFTWHTRVVSWNCVPQPKRRSASPEAFISSTSREALIFNGDNSSATFLTLAAEFLDGPQATSNSMDEDTALRLDDIQESLQRQESRCSPSQSQEPFAPVGRHEDLNVTRSTSVSLCTELERRRHSFEQTFWISDVVDRPRQQTRSHTGLNEEISGSTRRHIPEPSQTVYPERAQGLEVDLRGVDERLAALIAKIMASHSIVHPTLRVLLAPAQEDDGWLQLVRHQRVFDGIPMGFPDTTQVSWPSAWEQRALTLCSTICDELQFATTLYLAAVDAKANTLGIVTPINEVQEGTGNLASLSGPNGDLPDNTGVGRHRVYVPQDLALTWHPTGEPRNSQANSSPTILIEQPTQTLEKLGTIADETPDPDTPFAKLCHLTSRALCTKIGIKLRVLSRYGIRAGSTAVFTPTYRDCLLTDCPVDTSNGLYIGRGMEVYRIRAGRSDPVVWYKSWTVDVEPEGFEKVGEQTESMSSVWTALLLPKIVRPSVVFTSASHESHGIDESVVRFLCETFPAPLLPNLRRIICLPRPTPTRHEVSLHVNPPLAGAHIGDSDIGSDLCEDPALGFLMASLVKSTPELREFHVGEWNIEYSIITRPDAIGLPSLVTLDIAGNMWSVTRGLLYLMAEKLTCLSCACWAEEGGAIGEHKFIYDFISRFPNLEVLYTHFTAFASLPHDEEPVEWLVEDVLRPLTKLPRLEVLGIKTAPFITIPFEESDFLPIIAAWPHMVLLSIIVGPGAPDLSIGCLSEVVRRCPLILHLGLPIDPSVPVPAALPNFCYRGQILAFPAVSVPEDAKEAIARYLVGIFPFLDPDAYLTASDRGSWSSIWELAASLEKDVDLGEVLAKFYPPS